MGVSALALMAGTSLLSAGMQSQAIKGQARYSSMQNRFNSRMSTLQAEEAELRGGRAAGNIRRRTKAVRGAQRAGFAGQGVDINSGSALAVQEDTKQIGERDMLTARNNAWREAFGYRVRAADDMSRARMAESAGKTNSRYTLVTGGLRALNYGAQSYAKFKERK